MAHNKLSSRSSVYMWLDSLGEFENVVKTFQDHSKQTTISKEFQHLRKYQDCVLLYQEFDVDGVTFGSDIGYKPTSFLGNLFGTAL